MIKSLSLVLLLLLALLNYKLWIAESGFKQTWQLQHATKMQTQMNEQTDARNKALVAQVSALKSNMNAIEEQARRELGMIKQDEVFYRIVSKKEK